MGPNRDTEGLHGGFYALCEQLGPLGKRERDAQLRAMRHQGVAAGILHDVASFIRMWGTDDDPWSLLGRRVGLFEFLEVLGGGGMGVVYLARHLPGQFQCAVKISREACFEDFLCNEAEVLKSVHLSGVARILETGRLAVSETLELPYVATEVVFGWPIDVHCERYQLSVIERGRLLIALIETVASLYEQHALLHLDIKAANVLVDGRTHTPKLIDFGIARRTGGPLRVPDAFTPHTSSPEQRNPQALGLPGHSSDVFSLAVLAKLVLGGGNHRLCPQLRRLLHSACAENVHERAKGARTLAAQMSSALDAQLRSEQRQRRARSVWFYASVCTGLAVIALLLAPRVARQYNVEGRQLQHAQRPLMASRAFERATELAPADPTGHYNLATALEDIGDLRRARLEYHRAQENSDDYLPALNNLGRLLLLDGQPARAVTLLRRGLSLEQRRDNDRLYRLHKNLGWAYLELARLRPETQTAALRLARENLELALIYNRALKEEDIGQEREARHDAAGYCLLAKALAVRATARTSRAQAARLRWLWRTCRDTYAHGEPHYEGWKLEAETAMAAIDQ